MLRGTAGHWSHSAQWGRVRLQRQDGEGVAYLFVPQDLEEVAG